MAKVYSITNQKGGVGKTTTAVNLAASLGAVDKRVLLADMDPQGNATLSSGIKDPELTGAVGEMLLRRRAARECVTPTEAGYDLLPSNPTLTVAEVELMSQPEREYRLREALEPLKNDYDYILIDCPPTLSTLTINVLVAADGVIIPTQCEYFALEGLSSLLQTIQRLQETVKPELGIVGVLRTMFDPRNNLAKDVSEQLEKHFGKVVYDTVIPRNVTLAEAPSYGKPALHYDRRARGTQAYLMLAGEILTRAGAGGA